MSVLKSDAVTGTIQKSSGNAWFAELGCKWRKIESSKGGTHCQELTDLSWKSMLESPAWHDWLPSWQIFIEMFHIIVAGSHQGPFCVFRANIFRCCWFWVRTGDFANQILRTDHTHSVHYWSNRRTPLISRRILIVNYPLKSSSKHKIQHTKLLLDFFSISRVLSGVSWILVKINMKTVVIKIFNRIRQVTSQRSR